MDSFDKFAEEEYKAYVTYRELAKVESNSEFRKLLLELSKHELGHYKFWRKYSSKKDFSVNPLELLLMKLMRMVFGLTFIAKYMEAAEKNAIKDYTQFMKTEGKALGKDVKSIINDELYHENEFSANIKEERVKFISSMILGLNDALIEFTGVLVGLSFAISNNLFVAVSGLVTGVAATLSMTASAYMQASYEESKDVTKSAVYTGLTYMVVVLLLVAPFLLMNTIYASLAVMFGVVFLVTTTVSYYTSVIFSRSFKQQFGRMLLFSVGVSVVSFALGSIVKALTGISV